MAKRWRQQFLAVLRNTANVRVACMAAGVERSTAYRARNSSEDFKKKWDDALDEAADALVAEARRRALHGVERTVYYRGRPVARKKVYSDPLLAFLLRGAWPHVYGTAPEPEDDRSNGAIVELAQRIKREELGRSRTRPPTRKQAGTRPTDTRRKAQASPTQSSAESRGRSRRGA